jgi:hypothetical protein
VKVGVPGVPEVMADIIQIEMSPFEFAAANGREIS